MSYAGNPLVILFGVLMLHSGSAQNGKDFNVLRLKKRFITDYEGFLDKETVAARAGAICLDRTG